MPDTQKLSQISKSGRKRAYKTTKSEVAPDAGTTSRDEPSSLPVKIDFPGQSPLEVKNKDSVNKELEQVVLETRSDSEEVIKKPPTKRQKKCLKEDKNDGPIRRSMRQSVKNCPLYTIDKLSHAEYLTRMLDVEMAKKEER